MDIAEHNISRKSRQYQRRRQYQNQNWYLDAKPNMSDKVMTGAFKRRVLRYEFCYLAFGRSS